MQITTNFNQTVGLIVQCHVPRHVILNNHTNKATVAVGGTITEEVDGYLCLGKTVTRDEDLRPEIKRRIALGWNTFGKVDNIMRSRKAGMKIRRKVFKEYVIPVMTYGSDTWTLITGQMDALAVALRRRKWSGLCWT